IYGRGPLEKEIKEYIQLNGLTHIVELHANSSMLPIFAKTKIFVSTQLLENFPSMSMVEAMSTENAIIALNVGQTNLFVKDTENGFLVEESPTLLAQAVAKCISNQELLKKMQIRGAQIVENNHTIDKFLNDLENFWKKILLNG
ncbi:MAG: hypothetical protein ACD_22C00229G0002, partial [uncultured bacterium]